MKQFVIVGLTLFMISGAAAWAPVQAKRIKQQPLEAGFQQPVNSEIKSINGTSQEMNRETQKLVRQVAAVTQDMIRKEWKTLYVKVIPVGDAVHVSFYYADKTGRIYTGRGSQQMGVSGKKLSPPLTRQLKAAVSLTDHLRRTGQEMPSSVDITVTHEGRRVLTRFNYRERTADVREYLRDWETANFPELS